ncbi:MAG: alpha-1,3/4-fucosidase, partial [Bacteroidetes bacterium]
GEIKAIPLIHDENGPVASHIFGSVKKDWKLLSVDSEKSRHGASNAFDGFKNSYWQSYPNKNNKHYISIDLGKEYKLIGFSYTPQKEHAGGMIEKGIIKISKDGKKWQTLEEFTFGNLINDPETRRHNFKNSVETRYIRIESKVIAGGKNTAAIAELDFY